MKSEKTRIEKELRGMGLSMRVNIIPFELSRKGIELAGKEPKIMNDLGFEWSVLVSRHGVPVHVCLYSTGIDHAQSYKPSIYGKMTTEAWFKLLADVRLHRTKEPLSLADVFYALLMDSSGADESFENWCENCGHDSDSRKAYKTYQECVETAESLKKHFNEAELEKLQDMYQDY